MLHAPNLPIPGAAATYPVAEFRALVERQVAALGTRQADALKAVRRWELEVSNLTDELKATEEALAVEAGPLMHAAIQVNEITR